MRIVVLSLPDAFVEPNIYIYSSESIPRQVFNRDNFDKQFMSILNATQYTQK